MATKFKITDEQHAQAVRNIENFFAFTREVIDNPSILDDVPDGAEVHAIPRSEREALRRYDVETPSMVATVTPAQTPQSGHISKRQPLSTSE